MSLMLNFAVNLSPSRSFVRWLSRCFALIALLSCIVAPSRISHAQILPTAVTLTVDAGFAGYFRDGDWLPIRVGIRNDGGDLNGRLVVRPETSGDGIVNTYSAPVTLPSGARQTVFIYVTARIFASQVRVELIADDTGAVVTAENASLRGLQPGDRLNVVVTTAPVNAIDFTGVTVGSYSAFQADWTISDLPDRAAALDAVDTLALTDVDTSALTSAQREALGAWLVAGGHLIVTGGANWRATAAGVEDLLPFIPTGERTTESLNAIPAWLRLPTDAGALAGQTILADGTPGAGARVLVADADGAPLIVRGSRGDGTVDYLTVDPASSALRGWARLTDVWAVLSTTTRPQVGWSNGVIDWSAARAAVEILPGYDPLPDLLPLCGFLAAYIALIGPLNYLILNRLNRREWAWISIPALILVFSAAAYVIGGSLRGSEATLNRLTLVRAWSDSEIARADELIGLLSPRRTLYDLSTTLDDATAPVLRPIPRIARSGNTTAGTSLLNRDISSSIDIQQTDRFQATDFIVDASYIAGFHASGTIPRPAIDGEATFAYDDIAGQQIVRGAVRNDSDWTLTDPVILARGVAYRLDETLTPGDVATFDLTLPGEGVPAPALYAPPTSRLYFRTSAPDTKQSVIDILGADRYNPGNSSWLIGASPEDQAVRRQLLFLSSLVDEPYGSAGRADRVILAGWTDAAPGSVVLDGANWNGQAVTLLLLELATTTAIPAGTVTIAQDQFTWVVREQVGFGEVTPVGLIMQPGDQAVFEYTPLPDAQLASVEHIDIMIQDVNSGARIIPVDVWDWDAETWTSVELIDFARRIDDPARYVGAGNAIRLRLTSDEAGGYLRVGRLVVEQTGTF
ncbi:MAG: hypothetical protein SGI73_21105 [Chloroflexota bacterium]|nr:hypothetical protein [Chloroflexota bacterium]